MVSDLSVVIFISAIFILLVFFIWSKKAQKERQLLNKLFLGLAAAYCSWIIPLIVMRYVPAQNTQTMYVLDCLMQPGGALCAPLYMCIAVTFVSGIERLKKWMKMIFILPAITIAVAWTNPLHHLYYEEFSLIKSEIVFGPYIFVSGLTSYIFLVGAIIYMIVFGYKNKNSLFWGQFVILSLGGLVPVIVSAMSTFSDKEFPITATPLSFMVTLALNAYAIFRLHVLDIRPIADQHILNAISDSYVVLSESGVVIKYNSSFDELFAKKYGITVNKRLIDCVKQEDANQRTPVYNMLSALESSRQGQTFISYEQSMTFTNDEKTVKKYFVVDTSPLEINSKISGFVIMFKDITQLRESMKRLQDSQERLLEQERFAFLGQMIGGLAHNLKTPIMSISGCINATEALVDECIESLDDENVTKEDYIEIYSDMRDWFKKVKESTAYMSDIITAIKGQATNIETDEKITFTIDQMLKRSLLLMRHELLNSGCRLNIIHDENEEISLKGDINNMVQVIGNLLTNAIYSQKQVGGGEIQIQVCRDNEKLNILVRDSGTGISENVLRKLFKSMVTNKGTMGTGLGLYISNAVIRGKFNGEMWAKNNEDKGCTFGISIPLEFVHIQRKTVNEVK